jgi:hypothetical protein
MGLSVLRQRQQQACAFANKSPLIGATRRKGAAPHAAGSLTAPAAEVPGHRASPELDRDRSAGSTGKISSAGSRTIGHVEACELAPAGAKRAASTMFFRTLRSNRWPGPNRPTLPRFRNVNESQHSPHF